MPAMLWCLMSAQSSIRPSPRPASRSFFQEIPRWLLAPVPLALLQPLLDHMAGHVARVRPELFARLGPHTTKRFLINPVDLPFVLLLIPDAGHPHLKAYRRYEKPAHEAEIAGTFFKLLDMVSGSLDGDALFFSRDLRIAGDVEAVVALRNALDDFEGNVIETILSGFGPFSKPATIGLAGLRSIQKALHDVKSPPAR